MTKMKLLAVFVLAGVAVPFAVGQNNDTGDLSTGDRAFPISKLPPEVQADFLKIATGAVNAFGGSCLGAEPDYSKIDLLLYTNNTNQSLRLDPKDPQGIDYSTQLFILAHGWLSGENGYKIKEFREKYVDIYHKNIIFVNWGKLSWIPYKSVYCNIPYMAEFIAAMLCKISDENGYDLNMVHMIGHSFGGQLSGFTGKATQRICNQKLGRITALDPAGPIYQFLPPSRRLNPTDAKFVEVVHSASGTFGYLGKCGTVDYHLNCGSIQPGCVLPDDFGETLEASIFVFACHHFRSVEIWPYVIELMDFKAKSCRLCPALVPGTCVTDFFNADYIVMGHTYVKPRNNHYNVVTTGSPPFALGCAAYPLQGCT